MLRRFFSTLSLGIAMAALVGCTTTRLVEGQVQSFSTLQGVPAPGTYRIERLPSQQTPAFDAIEALAAASLARVGLRREDAAPALLVQLDVQAGHTPRHDRYAPFGPYAYGPYPGGVPWGGPAGYGGWFGGWQGAWYGGGVWGPRSLWSMGPPTPLHRRAVSVIMRQASTQAIVYETSAVHEDVWVQDPAVYGVLLDAALSGFPTPPRGAREVRLPLPGSTP